MFRKKPRFQDNEDTEMLASRRGFFARLAVGSMLTMAAPSLVSAASKTKHAEAHPKAAKRAAARLPKAKQAATKSNLAKHVDSHSHGVHKSQKNIAKVVNGGEHHARVSHVYGGKNHTANTNLKHHNSQQLAAVNPPRQDSLLIVNQGPLITHRSLAIQNPHTGDKLSLTYFEKGRYLNDALEEISFLLRDYRTDEVHPIDPELLDQLHDLKQILGLNRPFDVISGYRSPLTNAKLHAEHAGVANNSFHIHGRAVDIRIEGFDLRRAQNAALAMHRGGVGYYPGSNFMHLDTGTFRSWTL